LVQQTRDGRLIPYDASNPTSSKIYAKITIDKSGKVVTIKYVDDVSTFDSKSRNDFNKTLKSSDGYSSNLHKHTRQSTNKTSPLAKPESRQSHASRNSTQGRNN